MVRRFRDPVQVKVQVTVPVEVSVEVPVGVPVGAPATAHAQAQSGAHPGPPAAAELPSGAVPSAFIWRGRLYVVREVLAHWRERRAWWRDALDAEEEDVRPGETLAAAASEQHLWRVEASPGWSFASGVYDLAHDESAGCDPGDRWSLVRVAD